jgi:hypothetical protein
MRDTVRTNEIATQLLVGQLCTWCRYGHRLAQHAIAALRNRRTRPVERKIDLIRKPSKLAGPEQQLARYRALPIILRTQKPMLPQRVIGILNGQRRHRCRLPTAARLVITCAADSSGSVAPGTARAVSFHSRRMV